MTLVVTGNCQLIYSMRNKISKLAEKRFVKGKKHLNFDSTVV